VPVHGPQEADFFFALYAFLKMLIIMLVLMYFTSKKVLCDFVEELWMKSSQNHIKRF
jgi:hypothetical protein